MRRNLGFLSALLLLSCSVGCAEDGTEVAAPDVGLDGAGDDATDARADTGDTGADTAVDTGGSDGGDETADAGGDGDAEPLDGADASDAGDTGPGDTGPGDTGPGDTGPGDTGPGDTGPGDTGPGDTGPGDTGPGDTGPGDTGVSETSGADASDAAAETDDGGTEAGDADAADAVDASDAVDAVDGGDAADAAEAEAGCGTAADCPGADTECRKRTCTGGVCGTSNVTAGTPLAAQTAGDCKTAVCDGGGGVGSVDADSDVPKDGNVCTEDKCTAGVPSNPFTALGTSCASGKQCDGAGACVAAPSVWVVRVGDGAAALGSGSTATFVDRFYVDGATAGTSVALPVAASGSQKPLTLSGTATSEGGLSLTGNGSFVVLAGYAVAPGTASVTSSSTSGATPVLRVVGRIDPAGIVDTTTTTTSFSGNNVRSATSDSGARFWMAGGSNGVQFLALGDTTSTTANTGAPTNNRFLHVIGGQLYGTSGSSPFQNVFAVGTGLPTTGASATALPGMGTSGTGTPSPYSFALFDRDASVAGVDTLYLCDDRGTASGGGVQKWKLDGTGNWSLSTTFAVGGATAGVQGCRGLTAYVQGTKVILVVTTTESPARVGMLTDDGLSTPALVTIATAPTNTTFRGVALAPK